MNKIQLILRPSTICHQEQKEYRLYFSLYNLLLPCLKLLTAVNVFKSAGIFFAGEIKHYFNASTSTHRTQVWPVVHLLAKKTIQ